MVVFWLTNFAATVIKNHNFHKIVRATVECVLDVIRSYRNLIQMVL